MSFLETPRMPVTISQGAVFRYEWRRLRAQTVGGHLSHVIIWDDPLLYADVQWDQRDLDELHDDAWSWYVAVASGDYGFRVKDWGDYKSCSPLDTPSPTDEIIGTGTGALATFQLAKAYSAGAASYSRTIRKPVTGTVRVAVAGVEKTITTQWTLDSTTGIVTFTVGNIPTAGQAVTAGYEYDVPMRIESDSVSRAHSVTCYGTISLSLIEDRSA